MRTTDDFSNRENTVEFGGDIPGGITLIMPSGVEVDTQWEEELYRCNNIPTYDPATGLEVFYPGWASW